MSDTAEAGGQGGPTATFRAFTPAGEAGHVYNVGFTLGAGSVGELVKNVGVLTAALSSHGWAPAYGFAGPGQSGMHAAGRGEPPPVPRETSAPTMLATGSATGSDGPTTGKIPSDYYIVSEEPGGKARVKFWRTSRKYAEIDTVRLTENLPALLPGLPTALGKHDVATIVTWRQGNAKPSGRGHYQDITAVEAVPS